MSAVNQDVRGHCSGCGRWFFIPSDTVQAMMRALCPFCSSVADRFEQRCGDLRIAIDVDAPAVAVSAAD